MGGEEGEEGGKGRGKEDGGRREERRMVEGVT